MGKTVTALLAVLLPVAALAVDQHAAVQPDALVWSAGPPILPPGGEQVLLAGDPGKEGSPYVVRFKAPAGYKISSTILVNRRVGSPAERTRLDNAPWDVDRG